MAKGHISRKQLKQDAFSDMGRTAIEYVQIHRTLILAVVLGVVALFVVVKVGHLWFSSQRRYAANTLVTAQRQLKEAALTTNEAQRQPMLSAVIDQCNEMRREFAGSPAGLEAFYVKGNALYFLGEFDLAIAEFRNYVGQARDDQDRAKGLLAIAVATEDKAFLNPEDPSLLQEALETYVQAEDAGKQVDGAPSYVAVEAMLGRARVLKQQGNVDEARALYEAVVTQREFLQPEPVSTRPRSQDPDVAQMEEQLEQLREQIRETKAQFSFQSIAQSNLEVLEATNTAPAAPEN